MVINFTNTLFRFNFYETHKIIYGNNLSTANDTTYCFRFHLTKLYHKTENVTKEKILNVTGSFAGFWDYQGCQPKVKQNIKSKIESQFWFRAAISS